MAGATPTSRQRRARGHYAKSAEIRERILAQAMEVFSAVGYDGGSIRAIAEKAGMPETSVLHHFPSKQTLLLELLAQYDDAGTAEVADQPDVAAALVALIEPTNRRRRTMAELFARLSAEAVNTDHPAHDYFVQRYRRLRSEIAAALTDPTLKSRLRSGMSPESAARLIIASWDGLQLQWLLDRQAVNITDELKVMLYELVLTKAQPSR